VRLFVLCRHTSVGGGEGDPLRETGEATVADKSRETLGRHQHIDRFDRGKKHFYLFYFFSFSRNVVCQEARQTKMRVKLWENELFIIP
jgi:hypothetical protein